MSRTLASSASLRWRSRVRSWAKKKATRRDGTPAGSGSGKASRPFRCAVLRESVFAITVAGFQTEHPRSTTELPAYGS